MARLDVDRQNELEPKRMEYAKKQIESLGYSITFENNTELQFGLEGNLIKVFPYSGWFTGKGVKPGRGIKKLIDQLKELQNKDLSTDSFYGDCEGLGV